MGEICYRHCLGPSWRSSLRRIRLDNNDLEPCKLLSRRIELRVETLNDEALEKRNVNNTRDAF